MGRVLDKEAECWWAAQEKWRWEKNCVGYAVWAAGAGNGGVGLRKGKDEKGWAGRKELAQEGLENFKSFSTYFQVWSKIKTDSNSIEFYSKLKPKTLNNSK
jgi:hypothetical protein